MPFHCFSFYPNVADGMFGISADLLNVFVAILGVLATMILGILAIFGNQIRSYFFRPSLRPVDKKRTIQLTPKVIGGAVYHKNYVFHRLIIKNTGKVRATDVRVLLTYEKGNQKELENFIPIPLNWTHWNKTSRDISRGEPAYIDIFSREEDTEDYNFCWSQETGYSVEPLLLKFRPRFGNIRLEFFERDSKIGDIYLKYSQVSDSLEVVSG